MFCLCSYLPRCPDPPVSVADSKVISSAVSILQAAKCPLVIIGKGKRFKFDTLNPDMLCSIIYLGYYCDPKSMLLHYSVSCDCHQQ